MDGRGKSTGPDDCIKLERSSIPGGGSLGAELRMSLRLNGVLEERFICHGKMENLGCSGDVGNKRQS